MKIAIVADEFFDQSLGRMGGFGWVALAAARAMASTTAIEPVFVSTELRVPGGQARTNGIRILTPVRSAAEFAYRLLAEKFDAILTIDWRPGYEKVAFLLRSVSLVVWVQDPRTPYDVGRIATLQIPDDPAPPQGIQAIDCTGLRGVYRVRKMTRATTLIAGHAAYLEEKVDGTYGFHPDGYHFLPDPIRLPEVVRKEASTPLIVFLGRTDPIKRPWLVIELARRLPGVKFALLGQSHFEGAGSWAPVELPNVTYLGHADEATKFEYLSRAWALCNTSIHESLAISYLEALGSGVPLLAMNNPEELATRFGEYAGRWDGDGTAGIDHLTLGAKRILSDAQLRTSRGVAGSTWTRRTHGEGPFIDALTRLLGVYT